MSTTTTHFVVKKMNDNVRKSMYNQKYDFDCLVDHRFVNGKIEYLARYFDTVK